ncbi:MAG: hypothetical protein J0H82_06085 [Alphaproteobacteria bacterium]|jgi:hypothetical protein|nr:hypothetical protein [Alphaproteobacteria bacterium]
MNWFFSDACDQVGRILILLFAAVLFLGCIAAAIGFIAAGREVLAALFILFAIGLALGAGRLMVRR